MKRRGEGCQAEDMKAAVETMGNCAGVSTSWSMVHGVKKQRVNTGEEILENHSRPGIKGGSLENTKENGKGHDNI